ncbi:MAG: DUF3185 family protein [Opitutaceae bacterium]|nr:DUF3185 family protein [Opitutaceae bacterium]
MKSFPSLPIFIVGVVLLGFGVQASDSITSTFSRAFTGAPTDKSLWLIALGLLAIVSGGIGLVIGRRAR